MDEGHGVSDAVKGQGAGIVVQEDPDAGRVGGVYLGLVLVVAGGVAGVGAEEAPGFAVVSDAGSVPVSGPLDSLVGDP